MSNDLALVEEKRGNNGSMLLGTGLAVASLILVPAVAMRLGLSSSLTGALRIALMKASTKAVNGANQNSTKAALNVAR